MVHPFAAARMFCTPWDGLKTFNLLRRIPINSKIFLANMQFMTMLWGFSKGF